MKSAIVALISSGPSSCTNVGYVSLSSDDRKLQPRRCVAAGVHRGTAAEVVGRPVEQISTRSIGCAE
jgi:hypothetical protein